MKGPSKHNKSARLPRTPPEVVPIQKDMIRGFLIDPYSGIVVDKWLPSDSRGRLKSYYAMLRCSLVDVVRLEGNIDIWVDDEGIYKKDSAIAEYGYWGGARFNLPDRDPFDLWGRLLILKHDMEGESISLPASEYGQMIRPYMKLIRHG